MSGSDQAPANYRFFPYVREGYAPTSVKDPLDNDITAPPKLEASVKVRGSGPDGTSDPKTASAELDVYGPGEVTGIDERQVVRVEPERGTTDFPPNYFPFVAFDRPDLPWLFSPAAPNDAGRLRPWMCLVTVGQRDGVSVTTTPDAPKPVLRIEGGLDAALPDLEEADSWAHAQFVGDDATVESKTKVGDEFGQQSTKTASRLLSPRRLEPKQSYYACVVPTFEPGRRVGLGLKPYGESDDETTIRMAWKKDDLPDTIRLPVYFYWEFRTSEAGDFESLVRRLDSTRLTNVGIRDIDVSDPGPEKLRVPDDERPEVISLEGALRSAGLEPTVYDPDRREALREILNQASALLDDTGWTSEEGSKVLGPPLYGQWPPAAPKIPEEGPPTWLRDLNLDPRFRVPAGYGTKVIQEKQEHFMAAAWEQVGEIRRANQLLAQGQLAREAQLQIHARLGNLSPAALLQTTAPQHARIVRELEDGPVTVGHHISQRRLPDAALSTAFRRIVGPSGPLRRQERDGFDAAAALESLNDGTLSAGGRPGPFGGTGVLDDVTADGESVVDRLCARAQRRVRERDDAREDWDLTGEDEIDSKELVERLWDTCVEVLEATSEAKKINAVDASMAKDPLEDLENVCGRVCFPEVEISQGGDAYLGDLYDSIGESDWGTVLGIVNVDESRRKAKASVRELELLRRIGEDPIPEKLYNKIVEGCVDFDADFQKLVVRYSLPLFHYHCQQVQETLVSLEDDIETDREKQLYTELIELCEILCGPSDGGSGDSLRAEFEAAFEERAVEWLLDVLDDIDRFVALGEQLVEDLRAAQARSSGDDRQSDGLVDPCESLRAFVDLLLARLDEYSSEPAGHLEPLVCGGTVEPPTKPPLDLDGTADDVHDAIDPEVTIPNRLGARIGGAVDLSEREDPLDQIMAAPEFTDPMYEPLRDLSEEYFLPGVGDIPADSVSVLETNPAFVETYMVGLSHEMARELRWREYPTDQRGTYFRRFWERRGRPPEPTPEELTDIDYIHTWDHDQGLGEHADGASTDEDDADDEPDVVLLVRGKLLDRYPNTAIYAAKAIPDSDDGEPTSGERIDRKPDLPKPTAEEGAEERTGQTKHPIFRGTLDPDITFFGFDMSVRKAVGTTDNPENLGWFFVIEEPPGEPRFGLDVDGEDTGERPEGIGTSRESRPNDDPELGWNELSWGHLVSPSGEGPSELADIDYVPVRNSPPGKEEWRETRRGDDGEPVEYARWGKNAAHMAAITWQRPVRIARHADDMLPTQPD